MVEVYIRSSMLIDIVIAVFEKPFTHSYRILDQYLITNFVTFIRGFELAILMTLAVIFLLIAVGAALRQARRLPKSYRIEITDLDGKRVIINEFRQTFSTYEAAESYARFYRKMYDHQYGFKVIGNRKNLINVRATDSIRNENE